MVKREDDGTRLSVLQSRVAAHPEHTADETVYSEGQQVVMHRDGLGQMAGAQPRRRRLDPGHAGARQRAPDADLRITGSFPLNNIELALNALLPTLPVLNAPRGGSRSAANRKPGDRVTATGYRPKATR
jgi:transmembrane sensor